MDIVNWYVTFAFKTLAKLQYSHIKQDLEAAIIPLHVHVEEKITKGEYADYDTFLGRGRKWNH